MPTLTNWTAYRAGAAITITHSTGKITGVLRIEPRQLPVPGFAPGDMLGVVAVGADGTEYRLA